MLSSFSRVNPRHGLQNVDSSSKDGIRHNDCDSCLLFDHRDKDAEGECVQIENTRYYTNSLRLFNRKCCSWTPGLVLLRQGSSSTISIEQETAAKAAITALVQRPASEVSPTMFSKGLAKLGSLEQIVDDGSDAEDDKDDGLD